ncbi:MAG: DNA mismatch repair protein MutS [Pseudomonadota bacterium]
MSIPDKSAAGPAASPAPAPVPQAAASPPTGRDTPMIRQFLELKEQAPDCVLFFRMGDFYEMFFDDALLASRILSITLTSRDKGHPDPVPMCGVPHHALDAYLAKMVEAGFKVAICDQVEDPKLAKGLVRREITRVVSPGMFIDPQHLPAKDHRFLTALYLGREELGLAYLDLASGEFAATVLPAGPSLSYELARLEPAELVLAESQAGHPQLAELGPQVSDLPRSIHAGRPPSPGQARQILGQRLPAEEPGQEDDPALIAAAMAWSVVISTQRRAPEHVQALNLYQVRTHLVLDASARRNLEIYRSIAGGGRQGSLIQAVDHTRTGMGGRLLRQWLGFPLLVLEEIEARHQAVDEFCGLPLVLESLASLLDSLPDIPRLVGRASLGQASPRDLASLRDALLALPGLQAELAGMTSPLLQECRQHMRGLAPLAALLNDTLAESPPLNLAEGGVIKTGVDPELDEQRLLATSGKDWILALQAQLRSDSGIGTLKVGFNRVFGYYIEVTKAHLDKVPEHFIRRQTLATAERYVTPELKEQEARVLGAEERALEMERKAFERLRHQVALQSRPLLAAALAVAGVDVLAGLARLALSRDYTRPRMLEDGDLIISGGRHPVVERMLPEGEFVPNDLHLGGQEQVLIITGPNMAGKSTILRQVALIVLLAQAGSFVPAQSAQIPLVDRVFTRVGAMDDLARGRSTFMVEMTETSEILKQATPRSLVVLDEVGRGTSTYDGLSLAWAVAEHLHDLAGQGVKTLFATHYHELTELAATHPRIKNFNVAVKEFQGGIVFLRRLAPGGVSRSYGLAVARLAGLPASVLERARQILTGLEQDGLGRLETQPAAPDGGGSQMDLFATHEHPVLARLKDLDTSRLTPLEALNLLDELKRALS